MALMKSHAWPILVVSLAGWLNRQQQEIMEHLQEENRVLREHLKGKRIRFTDDQRRRLAAKGKPLGRRLLLNHPRLSFGTIRDNLVRGVSDTIAWKKGCVLSCVRGQWGHE
jgi:putative transposase